MPHRSTRRTPLAHSEPARGRTGPQPLERFAFGPPEWDLTSIAVDYTTFGELTIEEWQGFCNRYGYDVTAWSGFEVLRDARELRKVTFALQLANERPELAEQAFVPAGLHSGRMRATTLGMDGSSVARIRGQARCHARRAGVPARKSVRPAAGEYGTLAGMGVMSMVAARVAGGERVTFRPSGGSMVPLVCSRQEVELAPVDPSKLEIGDIVLVRISGNILLHLVSAVDQTHRRVRISNNRGKVNGWASTDKVYGICVAVDGEPRPRTTGKLRTAGSGPT